MSKKYTVKKNHKYKAQIKLTWAESFASNDYIKEQFENAGFENVKVTGKDYIRIATGEWNKEDQTAAIPSQVVDIEEEINEIMPSKRGLE
jgi:hypothetical protein